MMFNCIVNNHNKVKWSNNLNGIPSNLEDDLDNELPFSTISDSRHFIENHKIVKSEAQKCKTVGYRTRQKVKQEQDNKLPHLLVADLIQSTDNHKIIKYEPQTYETVDNEIEFDINQDNELPLSSIADFLRPLDHKLKNGKSKKLLETVNIQPEENNKQKIKQDNELAQISIENFRYSINNNEIIISEAQKCKTVGYRTRQKVKQEQDNKLPHLLVTDLIQSTDNHKIIKYEPQTYETVDNEIEFDINQDNELPLSSIADFLCPLDHKLKNGESKKLSETVNIQPEENNKQKIKQDNELAQTSIANFRYSINNNEIIISEAQKCKTVGYRTRQKVKQEQDNKLPHLLVADLIQSTDNHKIIKYEPQTYETVDNEIEFDINQDNELPLSSIADFLRPLDHKLKNGKSKKLLETVNIQPEENNKQKIKQDNELAQISIANFRYSINNNEIIISEAQKCKTVGYRTRQKVKQEQDNKLPHLLVTDLIQSTDNHKIIKYEPQTYETVDNEIEFDINQDNELPLSSIADFLRPLDHKLKNGESKKIETINIQPEENMDYYNKSDSERIILNEEQSTINNPLRKYECDICSKIFPLRTQIIKHFKTSLCYPDVIYSYDNL